MILELPEVAFGATFGLAAIAALAIALIGRSNARMFKHSGARVTDEDNVLGEPNGASVWRRPLRANSAVSAVTSIRLSLPETERAWRTFEARMDAIIASLEGATA